jgi:hypothetical protein
MYAIRITSLQELFSERLQRHTNNTGRNTCADDNNLTQIEFHASVHPLARQSDSKPLLRTLQSDSGLGAGAYRQCEQLEHSTVLTLLSALLALNSPLLDTLLTTNSDWFPKQRL